MGSGSGKRRRCLVWCWIASLFLAAAPGGAAAAGTPVTVRVNGQAAAQGLVEGGVVQVPARELLPRLGARVAYDTQLDAVVVTRGGTQLVVYLGRDVAERSGAAYPLGAAPRVVDGRLFVPARAVVEALGDEVRWQAEERVLEVTSEYARRLERAGRLPAAAVATGDEGGAGQERDEGRRPARIPYTEEDVDLLARLVMAEAWGEPYEGMVAVAAVVVNRVLSPRFPDTIRAVIFQPGQFPPAYTGRLQRVRVHPRAREAALDALHGADPSRGALYFYNPRLADTPLGRMTVRIGNHVFAR